MRCVCLFFVAACLPFSLLLFVFPSSEWGFLYGIGEGVLWYSGVFYPRYVKLLTWLGFVVFR